MATPKGMQLEPFKLNERDKVHVYSDDTHIWLQLRRYVPTEKDIRGASFKLAFCLPPGTARELGDKLKELAIRSQERQRSRAAAAAEKKQPVKN